jgi:hypothetical protein
MSTRSLVPENTADVLWLKPENPSTHITFSGLSKPKRTFSGSSTKRLHACPVSGRALGPSQGSPRDRLHAQGGCVRPAYARTSYGSSPVKALALAVLPHITVQVDTCAPLHMNRHGCVAGCRGYTTPGFELISSGIPRARTRDAAGSRVPTPPGARNARRYSVTSTAPAIRVDRGSSVGSLGWLS